MNPRSCYSFSDILDTNRFRKEKELEKGSRLHAITQSMDIWRKGQKKALAAYMPYHCKGFIVRCVVRCWLSIFIHKIMVVNHYTDCMYTYVGKSYRGGTQRMVRSPTLG